MTVSPPCASRSPCRSTGSTQPSCGDRASPCACTALRTTIPPLLQVYLAINSVVDSGGSAEGATALGEGESAVSAAIPDAVRSSTKSFTAKLGLGRSSKPHSGTSTPERSASQRGDGAPNRCQGAGAAQCCATKPRLPGLGPAATQPATLPRRVAAAALLQSLSVCPLPRVTVSVCWCLQAPGGGRLAEWHGVWGLAALQWWEPGRGALRVLWGVTT